MHRQDRHVLGHNQPGPQSSLSNGKSATVGQFDKPGKRGGDVRTVLNDHAARCNQSAMQQAILARTVRSSQSLRVTLAEAIEFNRADARGAAGEDYEELAVAL